MSLMSPGPGGAALLGGMQMGLQMRKGREQQAAAQATADNAAGRERRAENKAFNDDLDYLVKRFTNALPGEEKLLSYEYDKARKAWPGRELPSVETLAALVGREGFGNRADTGKYFTNEQNLNVRDLDGAMQEFIASVPPNVLLDPNGYQDAEEQLRHVASTHGLNVKTMDPYIKELEGRRLVASAQRASGERQTLDRTKYVGEIMKVIRTRAAMAYPSMSSGNWMSPGSPQSRLDPNHLPEYNAILARAEAHVRESWDKGIFVTPEEVMAQLRTDFRDVPQVLKAISAIDGFLDPGTPLVMQPASQNLWRPSPTIAKADSVSTPGPIENAQPKLHGIEQPAPAGAAAPAQPAASTPSVHYQETDDGRRRIFLDDGSTVIVTPEQFEQYRRKKADEWQRQNRGGK